MLAFVLLAFNIVYLYAPNITHWDWHWLMPGTVVGVCLWLLVSLAFKLYLSFFNVYSPTYGSLGAVFHFDKPLWDKGFVAKFER